jgi:predicted NUDIX family phosphoesterase
MEKVLVVLDNLYENYEGLKYLNNKEQIKLLENIKNKAFWVDREPAESNLDLRQIIPCAVFYSKKGIAVFQRRETLGEPRLRSKLTCLIGGHIEHSIDGSEPIPALNHGLLREMMEESPDLLKGISDMPVFMGIIKLGGNDVSSVHMGLIYICYTNTVKVSDSEELTFKGWSKNLGSVDDLEGIESWSKIVLKELPFKQNVDVTN